MASNALLRWGKALCLCAVVFGGAMWFARRALAATNNCNPAPRRDDHRDAIPSDFANHTLRSYSYSNCPFTLAKFNLYELGVSSAGAIPSNETAHMMDKARRSMTLSNDADAYRRVIYAIQSGALDRTIVLDGDSLTRQLFISLSCLAWSAGYVEDYALDEYAVWTGGQNGILQNFNYPASERMYYQARVKLKGGGDVYYIDYFNHADKNHKKMTQQIVRDACSAWWARRRYRTRHTLHGGMLPLDKDDVVVLGAGHHESSRETYISAYREMFECINNDRNENNKLGQWPHFIYQMSSVQSFWTLDGEYDSEAIPGKDEMTCRPSVSSPKLQEQDRREFGGLVPMIANEMKLRDMGEYHLGRGDCTHWIQPGIPDTFAAQLADMLMQHMPQPQDECWTSAALSVNFAAAVIGFAFFVMFLASTIWVREQTKNHLADCKQLKT